MGTVKHKPEKVSRLVESGNTRVDDDPHDTRRRSRLTRARSTELLNKSKKLIAAIRERHDSDDGA